MYIYPVVFAVILMLREVVEFDGRTGGVVARTSAFLVFVMLTLLTALRVDTGTDYPTYDLIWSYTSSWTEVTLQELLMQFLEPLFVITNSLLQTISDAPLLFFAGYALLTLSLLHIAIRRFPINPVHAYLVYTGTFLLPYAFNGMRQAVAMSIFLLALRPLLANRTATVLGYSIAATGFHLTGLLIPIAYVVHRLSRRRDFDLWHVLLVGVVVSGAVGLSGIGSRLFFAVFEFKAETYSELFSASSTLLNATWRLLLAAMLVLSARNPAAPRALRQLLLIYLVGLFIYLALADFNVLATRFNMFFRALEVILIPWTLACLPRWPRLTLHAVYCGLLAATLLIVAADPDYAYKSVLALAGP